MEQKLNKLFLGGFGLLLLALLAAAVRQWQYNSLAALAAALVLGMALLVFLRLAEPVVEGLLPAAFWGAFALLALGWLALLSALGLRLAQAFIMDMEVVYASLPDFLDGFPLVGDTPGYYMVCNNNLGIALLLTAFYRVLHPFGISPDQGSGLAAGILLNCCMIWLAVLLLCAAAWLLTRKRLPVLALLGLAAVFLPFYLYAPQFYSDTLVMPFLALAVVLYLFLNEHPSLGLAAALGAVIFLAYAVKGSAGVLLPAAAIVWLLRPAARRERLLPLAAMTLAFLALLGGYKAWQNTFLDWESADGYTYPTELWLCYGSHDMGNYSQADVDAANALPTKAERKTMLRRRIAANYSSRSVAGNLVFFARKAAHTWGEGKYDADEFTATPLTSNWTAKFTLPGQPLYMPMTYWCQVVQYLLLGLAAAGCLLALRGSWPGAVTLLPMTLWGGMLLLSVWETKPRYALHFAPLLLLMAALTLCQAAEHLLLGRREAAQIH